MCGRIYSRFCEEARCTLQDGCRAAATKIAHRCFMSGAAGLTYFKGIVQDMAAAGDHRAFCWELKALTHPGRPCWSYLVLCQVTEKEAASQNLLLVKPEVACIICQGVYDGTAPGTVEWTFHLDCGNGICT